MVSRTLVGLPDSFDLPDSFGHLDSLSLYILVNVILSKERITVSNHIYNFD